MYRIYTALLALGLVLTLPYWLLQMARKGKYRAGLRERLGSVPSRLRLDDRPTIWVHAVSVGEVLAVSRLVEEIRNRAPGHRVLISTTTKTGQQLARQRFGDEYVFYFPLDIPFAIRPYLNVLRPKSVIIAETEFWPNFCRLARRSGARIAVVNARISDRSFSGYRRWKFFLQKVLANIDLFLAQTEEDAGRLLLIGATPDRIRVTGNLKFDLPAPDPPAVVDTLRLAFRESKAAPILVCGSTVDGEEPLLLRAFESVRASYPQSVMVLAPRHPERFSVVAALLEKLGTPFLRRSLWAGEPLNGTILLLDTIGELAAIYCLADVAFVGGSLVPRGGHNIIEPAQNGVPVLIGNHHENFRDIVALFQARDAVRVVGPAEFPVTLMELLNNSDERRSLGERASATVKSQQGATGKTLQAVLSLLSMPAGAP
jgi:3-deoxy-D-manno-octulosonic-acid transferase